MITAIATDIELAARVRLAHFGSCASVGADSDTGFDPWFPLSGLDELTATAKRVCASCPVQDDCLTVALDYGEDYGIWGGLTASERRDLPTVPEFVTDPATAVDRPLPSEPAATVRPAEPALSTA